MAAPSLAQLREGLKTNLDVLEGCQVLAYRQTNLTLPSVFVFGPDELEYHAAMGDGVERWTLTVMAFAGTVTEVGAQMVLDEFVSSTGARSVKQAIEADKTLGGIAQAVTVRKCSGYRIYGSELSASPLMLGAEWAVEIYTAGT